MQKFTQNQPDDGLPDEGDADLPEMEPLPKLQKFTPLASGSISLNDADQVVTEGDKRKLSDELHIPWDKRSKPDVGSRGRFWWILSIFVLVGVGGLVFWVTNKKGELVEGAIPDQAPPGVAHIPQAELRTKILAALEVLVNSSDPDEVLAVVRRPERVDPLVRARLAELGAPELREITGLSLAENSALFSSRHFVLLKAVVQFDDFTTRSAAIEWRGDKVYVDWEHWEHYQPIAFEDFVAGKGLPEDIAPEFRLGARWAETPRLSEQFGESRYRSLRLRDPRVNSDEFTAYVERGSHAGNKLDSFLSPNNKVERPVMLKLRVSKGELEVTGWGAEGWCRQLW